MKSNLKLHLGTLGLLLWSSAHCAIAADDVWLATSPAPSLMNGASVNYSMGTRGGLHLELYSRRNPEGPGQRWNLNPAEPAAAALQPRFWSLGGSLDQVRTHNGGQQIVFVPQLVLDFAALSGSHRPFEAVLQYANWGPTPGALMLDQSLLQVAVRLQF